MARPRGSNPSDQIVSQGSPFQARNPDLAKQQDESGRKDAVAPSLGKPTAPRPVRLTSVEQKRLAEEFSSEIELQYESQANTREDIERWLKVYRGRPMFERKTYPLEHASNVVVQLAAIYSDQVIARIMQGIFGPEPHWLVQELNRKCAQACKPYERYLDWSRKNMWNQYEMVFAYVQDCVKLGTAIGYNDWQQETLFRYDDQAQQTVETGVKKGPLPKWVPREDFTIPIGFHNVQESPWIAHRVWFSWDRMEKLAHQGRIENLEELSGHSDDEDQVRLERRRNHDEMVDSSGDDRFGLWSPRYVWFRRDLDQDGWPEEYVMLLHTERRAVLSLYANPSPSGMRPYFTSRFIQVQGEFDGIGIPEQVESLQEEASTIHNQRRDRAHLANIVMYKARAAGQLPDTIRPQSGKVIKVMDTKDIEEFHPSTNVTIDAFEEDFVMKLAALRVGMNDVDMGKASSPVGRAAATTIMALMQEGARRFDLNVAGIRAALTEQGHQITELWQIYGLPDPEEAGSPEQVLDDEDAQLVRALLTQPTNLRGLVSIQLNVSTAAVNREVEKQSNMQLLQVIDQYLNQVVGQVAPLILNPQIPAEMKELLIKGVRTKDGILSKVFQSFNAIDLESVLMGDMLEEMSVKVQQQPQIPQFPQGMPGQPQIAGPQPQQGGQPGPAPVIPMRRA